jgi:hypothetical protein
MPRVSCRNAVLLIAALQFTFPDNADSADLPDAEFKRLHAELQPGDSLWLTIPWKISVLNAQRTAAKEDKPIFIWAMDGHPLGCT